MHLAVRRVGTVNTRGRADVAGSGKKLFRQKGTGNARAGPSGPTSGKWRRGLRPPQPRLSLRDAQAGRPRHGPHGDPVEVPGWPGVDRSTGLSLAAATRRRWWPRPAGDPPARSDRDRGRRGRRRDQDRARSRTLEGAAILIGIPGLDPVLHRSARNIEASQVAPVAEFNTYDILKQRYLVLTREALARPEAAGQRQPGHRRCHRRDPTGRRPRRAKAMVTLRRPPQVRAIRACARPLPGCRPAPDHREGHAPLGAAQRLHLRGQSAGDEDRDQSGRSRRSSTSRSSTSGPRTARQAPPVPPQARPNAELEKGDCLTPRGIPDRLLLSGRVASGQWQVAEQNTDRTTFIPVIGHLH